MPPRKRTLLLVEPLCTGMVHVEFNAALIAGLVTAYPDWTICIWAEASHQVCLRQRLRAAGQDDTQLQWMTLSPAIHQSKDHKRGPTDLNLAWRIHHWLREHPEATRIVWSSVNTNLLWVLQSLPLRHPTLAILHSHLESVLIPPKKTLPRLFWFKHALVRPKPPNLQLVTLGPSIYEHMLNRFPGVAEHVSIMDHPLLWDPLPKTPADTGPLSFAAIGNGSITKGTPDFFSLCDMLTHRQVDAAMFYIGRLIESSLQERATQSPWVTVPSPTKNLEIEDYQAWCERMHGFVFTYPPDSYQLRASGALFDVLRCRKPFVSFPNPYFRHYVQQFGPIGVLCDTLDDMARVIEGWTQAPEQYSGTAFEAASLKARQYLTSQTAATQIEAAFNRIDARGFRTP